MKYFNIHTFFFLVLVFTLIFVFRGITDLPFSILAREPFEISNQAEIPIIVHRENTTLIENIKSGMRTIDINFFKKSNINLTWAVTEGSKITNSAFTMTGTPSVGQYIDYLKTRDEPDILDLTGTTPHLFFLKNDTPGTQNLPIVFSQISDKFPPIIVYRGIVNESGFQIDSLKKMTQELCKALGLFIDNSLPSTNIMNSSSDGYDTNPSQMMTLKQNAATISKKNSDSSLSTKITDSLAEEAAKKQSEYKNNYYDNIQYHDTEEVIRSTIPPGEGTGIAYVSDPSGNRVGLGKVSTQPDQLYYTPGSFPFGSASYVPKYDDAAYLSKLTGETTASLLEDTAAMKGGFCVQEANNTFALDEKCRGTNKNQCASTTCCVLLGGAKCVAGNEHGPTMTAHYSDFTVKDRDYYYFQGKCYGHCPESSPL